MKFLDIDSPIGQFLCRIGDIITLNFLWIICSLPLITLGASTTALYYTWMKQYREGDSPVHRYFFSSFKDNLRKSTAAWILSNADTTFQKCICLYPFLSISDIDFVCQHRDSCRSYVFFGNISRSLALLLGIFRSWPARALSITNFHKIIP